MRALRFGIPLAVFVLLVFFLGRGLWRDPREIPSVLVDKPVPAFTLPVLGSPDKKFSPADYRGKVWLLNVWGSWCAACQVEHPLFNDLAKAGTLPIVGLAWKDTPENSIAWLRKLGNPYAVVVSDLKGGVAIDYGVYGAPETFLIDKQGVIRYIDVHDINERPSLEMLIRELEKLK